MVIGNCDISVIVRNGYAGLWPALLDICRHRLRVGFKLKIIIIVELVGGVLPHRRWEDLIEGIEQSPSTSSNTRDFCRQGGTAYFEWQIGGVLGGAGGLKWLVLLL